MLRRLHIENFHCLDNFTLSLNDQSSSLLIGNNGVGKTTIGRALEIVKNIAGGQNHVVNLMTVDDQTDKHSNQPTRFEIDVQIEQKIYTYKVALLNDKGQKNVLEESLSVNNHIVFSCKKGKVHLIRDGGDHNFNMDSTLCILPVIHKDSENDPVFIFKTWLSKILILQPIPSLMLDGIEYETSTLNKHVSNIGKWFMDLMISTPVAYKDIADHLKDVMPDFHEIRINRHPSLQSILVVEFKNKHGTQTLPLSQLSDGEKCHIVYAMVMAANTTYEPVLCFWDNSDNFLALSEVRHATMMLRRAFRDQGQLIVTSHNPEAIRCFSDENTWVMSKKNRMEPTTIQLAETLRIQGCFHGSLVDALIRNDIKD
jgi:ABC-type cobalamin/Fe3+-siderophores transport system ATPase subunit